MGELSELIKYLQDQYNKPDSFMQYLINTYGEISSSGNMVINYEKNKINLCDGEENGTKEFGLDAEDKEENETEEIEEEEQKQYLTFKNNKNYNLRTIEQLHKTIKNFESDFDKQEDETASKLVKNYIKELKKLEDNKELEKSDKAADKYTKILKKTLMKLWGNKRFQGMIKQYLENNEIHAKEYESGHKLTDDEFELLDEYLTGVMAVKTDNPAQKYEVIEMESPVIKIYFEEEDGALDYKYISGSCKFYNK